MDVRWRWRRLPGCSRCWMSGKPAHRALLTHEPLEVLVVEGGGQHLYSNGSIESGLLTAIDDTKTAAADLARLHQAQRRELASDITDNVLLGIKEILFGHRTA